MCGIAGIIANDVRPDLPPLLTRMTQLLFHRGPDSGGAVAFGPGGSPVVQRRLGAPGEPVDWSGAKAVVAIGARRLAIIDRSEHGHQPMSSPDGRAWIAFNGEIYNHVELREELRSRGMSFAGSSDTEVALAAYRAWGTDCFRGFSGMWAIAIVDWVAGMIVLSRDPFGIKPLYLAAFESGHAFASEIKSLLLLPGVTRDVNEARLRDFLVSGLLDHTNDTLFEPVWALQPGTWLEIDLRPASGTATIGTLHRIWPPDMLQSGETLGLAQLAATIDGAVHAHLRSDVPVGSCLSGGLDSSTIVSSIRHIAAGNVPREWSQHTFSAVLPGDPLDESSYIDAIHGAYPGLHDHRVTPDPARLVGELDRILWHQDEPFASPSILMQWEVMRLAREHGISVLLDGQGGDELFCGYPGYFPPYIAELIRHLHWGRAASEFFEPPLKQHFTRIGLLGHVGGNLLPRSIQRSLRDWRDRRVADYLAPELLVAGESEIAPYQQRIPRGRRELPAFARHGFDRFCWELLLSTSLPGLLHYEDRNSMAFSIEARVPFLDTLLVAQAMRLPAEQKLLHGRMKVILREAVAGRVPDVIRDRTDKIGFAAPTAAWLAGPMQAWWRDLFASKSFADRGCFEMKGVERLARRFRGGDQRAGLPIWRLAIVECWARRMLDRTVDGEVSSNSSTIGS